MNVTRVTGINKIIRSKAFTLFALLIILFVLFAIIAPFNNGARFITQRTIIGILQDIAVPAFLTIGAGCLMVSGAIDLSQARIGALSGMVVAVAIKNWQLPWFAAIATALLISALIGLVNAMLVNELNFQPFIATMSMSSVVYAVMYLVATDKSGQLQGVINYKSPSVALIGNYEIGGAVPVSVVFLVVMFIIYGIVLSKTKFGKTLYLMGGNATAARLSGINSKRTSYFLFINCAVLSGVSGVLYSSRTQQGSLLALANDQFSGLTAAILGGISFGGGSGGMGGAFLGLVVIKTFNKGMTIVGANSYLTSVLSGSLLLAALSLDYVSQRRQRKRVGI
jgi:ribose/xylose/arabinose/galactoside ABC-type transport system permease subunit